MIPLLFSVLMCSYPAVPGHAASIELTLGGDDTLTATACVGHYDTSDVPPVCSCRKGVGCIAYLVTSPDEITVACYEDVGGTKHFQGWVHIPRSKP